MHWVLSIIATTSISSSHIVITSIVGHRNAHGKEEKGSESLVLTHLAQCTVPYPAWRQEQSRKIGYRTNKTLLRCKVHHHHFQHANLCVLLIADPISSGFTSPSAATAVPSSPSPISRTLTALRLPKIAARRRASQQCSCWRIRKPERIHAHSDPYRTRDFHLAQCLARPRLFCNVLLGVRIGIRRTPYSALCGLSPRSFYGLFRPRSKTE